MTAFVARVSDVRWTSPRTVGIVGIFLGALAFWLTLPPLKSRTAALPVLIGILAVAAGIWAWSRDERRIGGGAMASGLLGIVLGMLALRSASASRRSSLVRSSTAPPDASSTRRSSVPTSPAT